MGDQCLVNSDSQQAFSFFTSFSSFSRAFYHFFYFYFILPKCNVLFSIHSLLPSIVLPRYIKCVRRVIDVGPMPLHLLLPACRPDSMEVTPSLGSNNLGSPSPAGMHTKAKTHMTKHVHMKTQALRKCKFFPHSVPLGVTEIVKKTQQIQV